MSDWQTAAAIIAFLTWFMAPPGGLADVARREALRRMITPKATQSLTNRDVASVPSRPLPTLPSVAAEPAAAETAAAPKPKSEGEAHDQTWWRTRMTTARGALERDQLLADALQSRINALTNDASARDDPAQRALLYEQRTRAIAELDNVKKQIDADRKAIADTEEDARKQGVPPGWIR